MKICVAKNNFNAGIVAPTKEHRWDFAPITKGVRQCDNHFIDIFGASYRRKGTTSMMQVNKQDYVIPFNSINGSYAIRITEEYINIHYNNDPVHVASLSSPLSNTAFYDEYGIPKIKYVQSGDAIYLTHPNKGLFKIQRQEHNIWIIQTLDMPTVMEYKAQVDNLKLNLTNMVLTSTTANFFKPEMQGMYMRLYLDDIEYIWEPNRAAVAGAVVMYNGNFYKNMSGAKTTGTVPPTHTYGTISDGSISWLYIHSGYVDVLLAGIPDTGNTCTVTPLDINAMQSSDTQLEATKYRMSGFKYIGFPTAIGIFANRLVIAINSTVDGPKIYMSKSGDFENFDALEFGKVTEATGIDIGIYNNTDSILWISAAEALYVGTGSAIFVVRPLTTSSVMSAINITYNMITNEGSSPIQPIRVDDELIYIHRSGKKVMRIAYKIDIDGLQTFDMSLLISELLTNNITSMTLVDFPTKQIVFSIKDSTRILCLTYDSVQSIICFYFYTTEGVNIRHVVGIHSDTIEGVVLYQVCVRTQYIADETVETTHLEYYDDIDYVDCKTKDYQSLYDPSTKTLSVYWPTFANKRVVAYDDKGKYSIATATKQGYAEFKNMRKLTKVGLAYASVFEPIPVQIPDVNGICHILDRQRINKVTTIVKDSDSFKYKDKVDSDLYLTESFKKHTGEFVINWPGDTTESKTGINESVYTSGARIIYVQDEPLPLNILAIYIDVGITNDYNI